jgi:enoyl-CoA hydratase/carnithine racemase
MNGRRTACEPAAMMARWKAMTCLPPVFSWPVPVVSSTSRWCAEALLLGEPFLAEAALEVGLVNRVVPPTECNSVAQAQARKLAAKPLASLIATKRLMKQPQHQRVLDTISEEAQVFAQMLQEPAAREAFGAFMEKRRPDFSQL